MGAKGAHLAPKAAQDGSFGAHGDPVRAHLGAKGGPLAPKAAPLAPMAIPRAPLGAQGGALGLFAVEARLRRDACNDT